MLDINQKSNVINIVLIIFLVALIYWLAPHYESQLTGIVLPISKPSLAVPANEVQLINNTPLNYKPLAYINFEQHAPSMDADEHQRTLADAMRSKAGSLGANAVLITAYGQSIDETSALTIYELQGIAVTVP